MAFQSVITLEKPIQRLGLSDWNSRLNQFRNVADTRRIDAFELRHSSRTLRNETRIEADWSNYETNESLSNRVSELNRWRQVIEIINRRIGTEKELLREETAVAERELDAMLIPLTVISQCLSLRDRRFDTELINDDPDAELKKELAVVENNQRLVREQCQNAWDKLTRLEDVQFKISLDLDNKTEAVDIDSTQLGLNKFSANISFKTDPSRHPRNSCEYETWLAYTKDVKEMAENELSDTYAIRESLFVCRMKARNMLLTQQEWVDHVIRKRIFETQRARNELEWQKLKLREEMEKALCEIKSLEPALRDKADALKLAETRLENRAQRAGAEQCLDEAYHKLCAEVLKLRRILRTLQEKIDVAKGNFALLEDHAQKIDADIEKKQFTIMNDVRCIDLRARLNRGEQATGPSAQTERNIKFAKMEEEIPKT